MFWIVDQLGNVVGEVAIIYMADFQMRAKTGEHPEINK